MGRIGEIGLYQVAVFAALSLGIIFEGLVILSYVFVAATPGHHCATPELDQLNITDSARLNLTVPPDSGGSYSVGEVGTVLEVSVSVAVDTFDAVKV